jgi:hypothetical protein
MLKNQNGSALLWVLGAASVVAVISAALPQFFNSAEQDFKVNYSKNSITMIKESLIALLGNDAAWVETLRHNSSMDCLKTAGITCSSGLHSGFDVYDADGALYLAQNASSGFTLSGEPCNQFSAAAGHATCVVKFNLSWECNGACVPTAFDGVLVASRPNVKLKADLIFAPLVNKIKNLIDQQSKAYSFDILRGTQAKTISNFCNSMNGVFNQQKQTCKTANSEPVDFDCTVSNGPHAILMGFENDGTPQCWLDLNVGTSCPEGEAITGFRADGRYFCGAF